VVHHITDIALLKFATIYSISCPIFYIIFSKTCFGIPWNASKALALAYNAAKVDSKNALVNQATTGKPIGNCSVINGVGCHNQDVNKA
jgi:hypothetical protein